MEYGKIGRHGLGDQGTLFDTAHGVRIYTTEVNVCLDKYGLTIVVKMDELEELVQWVVPSATAFDLFHEKYFSNLPFEKGLILEGRATKLAHYVKLDEILACVANEYPGRFDSYLRSTYKPPKRSFRQRLKSLFFG